MSLLEGSSPIILLVDDSSSARQMFRQQLDGQNYTILEAENGKEAVKLFMIHEPDLILMDANMPVVDGFRACLEIKQRPGGKETPVIMVTGTEDEASIKRAFEVGAQEFVTKPVLWEVLRHRIQVILERVRTQLALMEQQARMDSIFDTAVEAIIIVNQDGIIDRVNRSLHKMFGYTSSELVGENVSMLVPSPHAERHDAYLEAYLSTGKSSIVGFGREVEGRRKDGSTFPLELSVSEIKLPERHIYTGIIRDITERKKAQQLIEHQANYDALTDLPNRSLFMKNLQAALDGSKKAGTNCALIFIDLDRFKWVNDNLGHPAGDELLIAASQRILACLSDNDSTARLGGDEFTAILGEVKDTDEAIGKAEAILTELNRAFDLEGSPIHISGSLGIALYPQDAQDLESLLKAADDVMYKTKQAGRNGYHTVDGRSRMMDKKY